MNNIKQNPVSGLYETLKRREEIRLLIPMGYVPGMPVITIKNGQLAAVIPFLRYKITGEADRTLVFPIRYVLEYLVPEAQLVSFRDLSVEEKYGETDFNKAVGLFRHESIKNLDKKAYNLFRDEVLAQYDRIVNFLTGESESEFTQNDEIELRRDLQTIIEPSLLETYKVLDIDFYNKYLKK